MESINTLINPRWIAPVVPENQLLDNHSVAVHDGRIVALLPTEQAKQKYTAEQNLDLPQHILIPGLINSHTHASMSLLRGLADDLPLMEWLNDHIWPAEAKWVNKEFVADGTQLAIAEMLLSGTTCMNEMYFFPDVAMETALQSGMRSVIGMIVIDFPTVWAKHADEYIEKGLSVHDEARNHSLVSTCFAPHAPYTVSDKPLEKIQTLAEEMDVPIHMHVHETSFEVQQSVEQSGKRPLQRLHELNLISPRLLAVHMTDLNREEMILLAEQGANVVHCPESNLKLASGFCPVGQLQSHGVNICIGTDGAASNNDLDMMGEMRSAALLAKAVAQDAKALPAFQTLKAATINGAKALGLEKITGSIEVNKAADLVAVNLDNIHCQPVYHPISQLIYASTREQVTDVWVAGKQLVKNRQLVYLDQNEILEKAKYWQDKIRENKT